MTIENDVPVGVELIEDIVYAFQRYCKDSDLRTKAHYFVELCNRMSDLQTYHPGYDYESGTMPWERDDE